MVGRARHVAVIVAVELVYLNIGMSRELHHAPHVEIFLVASEKLLLGVAGDYDIWRSIGPHMKKRGKFVDNRLRLGDALQLAVSEMGDYLAAVGHQGRTRISSEAIFCEPLTVESYHARQIASGRVTGNKDFAGVTAISCDIAESPGHGGCSIINALAD